MCALSATYPLLCIEHLMTTIVTKYVPFDGWLDAFLKIGQHEFILGLPTLTFSTGVATLLPQLRICMHKSRFCSFYYVNITNITLGTTQLLKQLLYLVHFCNFNVDYVNYKKESLYAFQIDHFFLIASYFLFQTYNLIQKYCY